MKLPAPLSLPNLGKLVLNFSTPRQKSDVEPLLPLWAAFSGLLVFSGYLLYQKGVWASLLSADPTYLTALIVVLFIGTTIWVGFRANTLTRQHQKLLEFERLAQTNADQARNWLNQLPESWAQELFKGLQNKESHWRDNGQLIQLLAEKASAPHEMAWWLNGVLLKLGLLGKVIGFSIMALQLGAMDSFDSGQTSAVLKTLTGGLGIALLTTMTGLTANILLGIQLMRLDRFADHLTAKAIKVAEIDLQNIMDRPQ